MLYAVNSEVSMCKQFLQVPTFQDCKLSNIQQNGFPFQVTWIQHEKIHTISICAH